MKSLPKCTGGKFWLATSVDECFHDTGRPPIPMRWVVTNRGDELRPKVRCRLVATHLAARYGGKDAEEKQDEGPRLSNV